MNNRRLAKAEALEQLIICRQRLGEVLNLSELLIALRTNRLHLNYDRTATKADYHETLRTAFLSWLASLIDKSKDTINIFDVWIALFPSEAVRIRKVWADNQPGFELLREFRNKTGFHGNKAVQEHLKVRAKVLGSKAVEQAAQELFALAGVMMRLERQSNEFRDTVEVKLKQLGLDPEAFLRRFAY
jgi:hypothetical protein